MRSFFKRIKETFLALFHCLVSPFVLLFSPSLSCFSSIEDAYNLWILTLSRISFIFTLASLCFTRALQFRDLLFCMQLFLLFQPLCCALQPFFKKLLPLFWSFTLVFCLVLSLSSLAFLGNYIYLFSCPKSKKKSLSRLYADLCCFRIEFNISIWFS